MSLAPSTKLFLPFTVLGPCKAHNRAPLQKRVMGFAPKGWKRWNLAEFEEGCEQEEDDAEEEEGGGVVAVERKGGEREGFI